MAIVYVHKYALSTGKIEAVAGEFAQKIPDMFIPNGRTPYHKGDYSLTKEEAIKQAEIRRVKKIASLKKQIDKLSNLNFNK